MPLGWRSKTSRSRFVPKPCKPFRCDAQAYVDRPSHQTTTPPLTNRPSRPKKREPGMSTIEFAPGITLPTTSRSRQPKRFGRPPASWLGVCLLVLTIVCCAMNSSVQAVGGNNDSNDTFVDFFPIPLFSGLIAILPDPAQPDLRRTRIGQTLAAWQMDRHVVYLTPEQMVDPGFFNAESFPVALYLGGERYWQTVREAEDGDAALQRHLDDGGRLLVLPYGPLPFFYDQKNTHVASAGTSGCVWEWAICKRPRKAGH